MRSLLCGSRGKMAREQKHSAQGKANTLIVGKNGLSRCFIHWTGCNRESVRQFDISNEVIVGESLFGLCIEIN